MTDQPTLLDLLGQPAAPPVLPIADAPGGNPPALTIRVYGEPAPQGSKKLGRVHKRGSTKANPQYRPVILDDNNKTAPWRQRVEAAAWAAMVGAGQREPLVGPVAVEVTFTVKKPLRAPKRKRTWPAVKPDVDKYQRSTFDALTTAGVYKDDGQIIDVRARKVYPGEHPDALSVPGAVIRIWLVTGDE